MNPSAPLKVMCIGTLPGARPATCDPAIDLARTSPAALTRYERERSEEARAEIVLFPQATPTLFEVQPLTAVAWRWVQEGVGETRFHRAFHACCHLYSDERGVEHKAKVEMLGRVPIASDEWLESILDRYGAAAVREVAQVAINRTEAGPRALAPFALPHGLTLAR